MNEIIENRELELHEKYKIVLEKIKEYDKIVIFRHIKPDFDALGTQLGLEAWLKANFKDKEIYCVGDNHVAFTPNGLFRVMDSLNDSFFNNKFLGIIVDVGDKKRIADPRFERADYLIKIDHHPETDKIFDLSIVDTSLAAASELVCNMLLNFGDEYVMSQDAARNFYIALVGDSGRFQYSSTTSHTFQIASTLINTGINITRIYEEMYQKEIKDLEVMKFILNAHKVTPAGTCYYVLTDENLKELGLSSEQGKDNVNLFSTYKGIKIWCSITEDTTEPCFRISIRSRNYIINDIASEFKGGGHEQAAGCQIKDLTELDKFLKACDDKIISEDNK